MEINRLDTNEWQRLKRVRLDALRDAPDAFGSTLSDAQAYSDADWRKQIETLATFVAVHGGKDIGMVRGAPDDAPGNANDRSAFLISMWVAPDVRGQGIGEQLIEAIVTWSRHAGFARIELDVADDNHSAIALYEKMNFVPTGVTGSLPPPRTHVLEHRRALDLSVE